MTKRSRLFLLIGGGVLLTGITAGLLASYMGLPAIPLGGSPGPRELALVPADAHLVAYANVRDLMSSDARRKLLPLRAGTAHADFEARTGINPETDIETLVIAFGDRPAGQAAGRNLVLARGNFNEVQIEALIREHDGQVAEHRGKRLLTRADGDHPTSVVFLEPGLVAVGGPESVRQAIDLHASAEGGITTNDAVMGLVRDVERANAWVVGRFDAIVGRAVLPADVSRQLPPIQWFSASGQVTDGIEASIRVQTRDEAASNDFRQVLQGFVALARLQSAERPELSGVLNSIRLGGQGTITSLDFSIPGTALDSLAAAAARRRTDPAATP